MGVRVSFLLGLFLFTTLVRAEDTLAPHPLYFTVDGKPTKEKVKVEDKTFIITWNGEIVDLLEEPDIGEHRGLHCLGCALVIVGGLSFWVGLAYLIWIYLE